MSTVTPLILLGEKQYADTKPPREKPLKRQPKTPPPPAAEEFAQQVLDAWGTDDIFIDASALAAATKTQHLDNIAAAGAAAGLSLIPATTLKAPAQYQAAVQRMITADKRGAALRIDLTEAASAATWAPSWFAAVGDTDLIIDLQGSVRNVAPLVVAIPPILSKLHQGKSWRTVTIAGGSIPQMLTGFTVGTSFIPRQEIALWATLSAAGVLPFRIDFGDYANIAPDALDTDIPPGFPINARYALRDRFLIRHGVPTLRKNAVKASIQLLGHAKAIVNFAQRAPLAHCWGDTVIDGIAAGTHKVGNLATWVRYTVNRHLEVTRHRLP